MGQGNRRASDVLVDVSRPKLSMAAIGREDILISDVGLHKLWIGRMFPAHEPTRSSLQTALQAWASRCPARWRPSSCVPSVRRGRSSRRGGLLPPVDVDIDEHNVFAPDLSWVSRLRSARERLPKIPGLCVEIRSPTTWRDEQLTSPQLPGFSLRIAELFRDIP
jgi:hypothetical protein